MGRTLNLLDHLLARSRELLDAGRPHEALPWLRRVTRLTDIPLAPAAEGQRLLGAALLRLGEFKAARRQLRQAARWQPDCAANHHLLARAIAADPHVDAARATKPYQRALELDPANARLLADAGAYFVEMGKLRQGVACLEKAVELAPEDLGVLGALVEALCEVEHFEEARKAVRVARFRFGLVEGLAQMRDGVEFRHARHEQAAKPATNEPEFPPFLRIVRDEPESVRGKKYRRDAAAKGRPHLPRFLGRFDARRGG